MSDLDRFELFTYVVQYGSLSKAANALNVTKASLSKQIKRLEHDLNIDLFSRHGQRLTLTDQGSLLVNQCKRLKKELDDTRSLASDFLDEPEGSLHVVTFGHFARTLIFPKLKAFLERYPKLEVFIDLSERIPAFEREQVDLAVGFSIPVPLDIICKRMMTTRYVMAASPAYFNEHGTPQALQDLLAHRYIEHSARLNYTSLNLTAPHQLKLKPYLVLNSVPAMVECAKQDIGLVQLPLYVLEESLKTGELTEVLVEYQASNANVYYYYPKFRHTAPKVRKFIDFFLGE